MIHIAPQEMIFLSMENRHQRYNRMINVENDDQEIKQLHLCQDRLVVECWHRVREVPGSTPSQGPRHTKDVIKMVPVVPLCSTEHQKGKYWLFLKN